MNESMRILGFTSIASAVFGSVVATIAVLAPESAETIQYSLSTVNGALNLLSISVFASLPISIPAGLIGGVLAGRFVAREKAGRSLISWVWKGSRWGGGIGAIVAAVVYAVPSVGSKEFLQALLAMILSGGATGSVVGAIVGVYCARVIRFSTASRA